MNLALDPHIKDQFMFIHDAILESVTCGDTQITATDLRMTVDKMKRNDNKKQLHGFQYQFKVYTCIRSCVVRDRHSSFADFGAGFS